MKAPKDIETTHQPARMVAGHCPSCKRVVVVFNNHGVWPPVVCACGWIGGTAAIAHHVRYENGGAHWLYRAEVAR